MENDHNNMERERNSFQNVWKQPSFKKTSFQNITIVMMLD